MMKLNECKSCTNHVLYENGYLMCNYNTVEEQRVTDNSEKKGVYVVNCPMENDENEYSKISL